MISTLKTINQLSSFLQISPCLSSALCQLTLIKSQHLAISANVPRHLRVFSQIPLHDHPNLYGHTVTAGLSPGVTTASSMTFKKCSCHTGDCTKFAYAVLQQGKRLRRQWVISLATKMTVVTSLAVRDPSACRSARGMISSTT